MTDLYLTPDHINMFEVDIVQLDGSNCSDSNGSRLSYSWNQISILEISSSDSAISNPTFRAPEVNEQTDITFQLTVTNEEGMVSKLDEIIITIKPLSPPTPEEPKTISNLL